MSDRQPMQIYLESTPFIESSAPPITELASSLTRETPTETAIALFDWVRDRIRYDPRTLLLDVEEYRATAVLKRGRGFCVHKAVLLAALGRAASIPTRLGFADVRNHQTPEHLLTWMGTDLFVFHGYVEFFLDERWVKATPAFDADAARRAGALLVQLDGTNDAMLHPVDPKGHPHIEYVQDRGSFADLPFDAMRRAFREAYPRFAADVSLFDKKGIP